MKFWLTIAYLLPVADLGLPPIFSLMAGTGLPPRYIMMGIAAALLLTTIFMVWRGPRMWAMFAAIAGIISLPMESMLPLVALFSGVILAFVIYARSPRRQAGA